MTTIPNLVINHIRPIPLMGEVNGKKLLKDQEIDYFVKTVYSNQFLDAEFFKTTKDLMVSVTDIIDNIVYEEVVNTANTFHLIINIEDWLSGPYTISMTNNNGLVIFGHFFLK